MMAPIPTQLNITGMNGLAPDFAGDLNSSSSDPTRRYIGVDGQVADGIYNPLRIAGYMGPANNTFTDLTGTIAEPFISRAYVSSTDTLYLAQEGANLSTLSGLDDTSITSTATLPGSSVFRDLELYEINGFEALFYAYRYLATGSSVTNINLGWLAVDTGRGAFQVSADVLDGLLDSQTTLMQIADASGSYQALAQAFRTQDFNLANSLEVSGVRVALRMPFSGTTQNWTLRAAIYDSLGGTIVTGASATMPASDLPVGELQHVYFNFAAPVTLTADTTYYLVLEPTNWADIGANEGVQWISSILDNDIYTGGRNYRYDGTTWEFAAYTTENFDFALIANRYSYVGYTESDLTTGFDYISYGTSQTAYTASATTLSLNISTDDTANPCIIVGINVDGTSDIVTSVTCDGVAMNLAKSGTYLQYGDYLYLYSKTGISSGSHTITVNTSGATSIVLLAAVYYGVNQANPTVADSTVREGNNTSSLTWTASVADSNSLAAYGRLAITMVGNNKTNGGGATTAVDGYIRAQSVSSDGVALADGSTPFGDVELVTGTTTSFDFSAGGTPDWASISIMIQPPLPAELTGAYTAPFNIPEDVTTFLVKGDNGLLYLFTNNIVHKFDGGSPSGGVFGTLTPDVLTFPDYFTIVDAVDTQSIMYIAVQTSETALGDDRTFSADTMGVYSWDRVTTSYSMRNFVPIYGAREIKKIFVTAEGDLRVITIGEDGFTEIRAVSGGKLVVVRRLGREAYPVLRDSMDVLNNMSTWLGADGVIYTLGTTASKDKEQLYKIGTIAGEVSGTLTSGILSVGNESTSMLEAAFIGFTDTTAGPTETHTLTKWYPHATGTINSVAQKPNQGDIYSLSFDIAVFSTVHYVHIFGLPTTSDGATNDTTIATIKVYFNRSTTASQTWTVKRKDMLDGFLYLPLNKKGIFAVQFEIEYPTGGSALALGTADFTPSRAVLVYEPLPQLK